MAYPNPCLDRKSKAILSNTFRSNLGIYNIFGGNMLLQSKFFRLISIFTIILSLTVFTFADTLRLKDGSILKGKIIGFENNQFIILIGSGERQRQLKFYADEVLSVKFDSNTLDSNSTPTYTNIDNSRNTPPDTTTSSNKEVTKTPSDLPKTPSYEKTNDGNTTIITVGSAPRKSETNNDTPPPPADNNTSADNDIVPSIPPAKPKPEGSKPIRVTVKVLADETTNGWTNTGWVVRKGQRIRIISSGRVSLGDGRYSSADGISTLPDENKLIKDKPTGSLIGVIGDDNNEFIYIGSDKEFVAERDGALFLGVNEGNLSDNTGSFEVTIEILPAVGS